MKSIVWCKCIWPLESENFSICMNCGNQLKLKNMEWKELPVEIQEKMLERQAEQGNKRNPRVFERNINLDAGDGAFDWDLTPEGSEFWVDVLYGKFEVFYKMYPKYPKVMLVSDNPERPKECYQRVVFMEKNGRYFAWDSAETIEDAKKTTSVVIWDYAVDIPKKGELEMKIDDVFFELKHEVITEKEAHNKIIKLIRQ